jgi:predicted nucleotidyltransferase
MNWSRIPSLNPRIESALATFIAAFPTSLRSQAVEVLLIGSASRGEATYRSDLDVLVVLRAGPLTFSRVQELRDLLDRETLGNLQDSPLEFQVQFALASVFHSEEPAMREALKHARVLIPLVTAA